VICSTTSSTRKVADASHIQSRAEVDEEIRVKEDLRRNPPKPRRESLSSPTGYSVAEELADAAASVAQRANAAFDSGLTEEAIVILATAAAPWPKGAKHKLSEEQVRAALEGFRNLKKYLGR
jgi:hypothetical protein